MMWLVAAGLLGAMGILLIVSFFCFRFAIRAGRINDYSIWETADKSIYRDFHSMISENARWAGIRLTTNRCRCRVFEMD